jgi:hypothetical protein
MSSPALFNQDADVATASATPSVQTSAATVLKRLTAWYMGKVQAERDAEITAFVAERGGHFTDDMEREISRRVGGMAG